MKFFFYGVFLEKAAREQYRITDEPRYATVKNYLTVGDYIVQATSISSNANAALSGIIVDVPEESIERLDELERSYDRVTIETTYGERAEMYVAPILVTADNERSD